MRIDVLKKFFTVSVAAFDFSAVVRSVSGEAVIEPSKMERLHRQMLSELQKENPNEEMVFSLLEKMEKLAKANIATPKRFADGGIVSFN